MTQIGGSLFGTVSTDVALPGCNGNGGETASDLDAVFELSAVGGFAVNATAIISDACGNQANTMHSAFGGNNVPGQVTTATIASAFTAGSGTVTFAIGGEGAVAIVLADYLAEAPSGGLTGSNVLVYYGTFAINTAGTAMGSASVGGPGGVTLTAAALTGDINGTIVDVFSGTTTIYTAYPGLAMAGTFAVVVPPGLFTITSATDSVILGTINVIEAGSSVSVIGVALAMFDSSTFPPMTTIALP